MRKGSMLRRNRLAAVQLSWPSLVWCCFRTGPCGVESSRAEKLRQAPSRNLPFSIYRQAEKALRAELRKVHEEALAAYEVEATEASDSCVKLVRQSSEATLKESLAAKEASLADALAAMRAEKEAAEKSLELREEAHAKASMNRALRHLQRASTTRAWCCWQKRARAFSLVRTTLRMMRSRTAARAKAACPGLHVSGDSQGFKINQRPTLLHGR